MRELRRAGVLTVSDAGARGDREDVSGRLLAERLSAAGMSVVHREIVPDDVQQITATLEAWCDDCALIVTTGGTGFAPRDVTPEATAAVIERSAPGLAEYIRWSGYHENPRAALSRGIVGIRGGTLIVNLPGSPRAVSEGLDALLPIVDHALALIGAEPTDH